METSKNAFSSIWGFIMTAIGFAVGVGSIWRFPYMLGENGGALYLIAYVVVIAVIGIPLLTAEIAMGFSSQKTSVLAYKALAPGKKWYLCGYAHLTAGVLIISYTIPVYAWILKYLVATPLGDFHGLDAQQIEKYFGAFVADRGQVLLFALANIFLNALVVSGGVKKGIERASTVLLPVLGVIMVIMIVFGVRLPYASGGVSFLLKPDTSKFSLASLQSALGQSFFAVGIAMLAAMVFGSYIKTETENIGRSSVIICTALVLAGVLAGFMIFPVLFSAGLSPNAGPGLAFISLPNAFNQITLGRLMGTLFYLGFYIAAVTSSAGVMESVVGLLMDQFDMKRRKALSLTVAFMTIIGTLCVFNDALFNLLDVIENTYLLTLGALCISIFVGWVWGIENFLAATNVKSDFFKIWLKVTVKYICPIAIVVIFIGAIISG